MTTQFYHGASSKFAIFSDDHVSGVNGGTSVVGLINRPINKEVFNEISGASLATNKITLPAGKYFIRARAAAYLTKRSRIRLFNFTNNAVMINGEPAYSAGSVQVYCKLSGVVDLWQETTFGLQQYSQAAVASFGYGVSTLDGASDEFVRVTVEKVG